MTREELKQEAEELIQRFEMANSMNCYMSLTPDRKQIGEMLVMIAEPREKRIAELEAQIEKMKCFKNCPDNKGGLLCQKEYEDKCLAQKIQYIKELKEENKKSNVLFADIIEAFTSCSYNDDFEMAQAGKEIYELFYGGKDPKEVFHNAEVPKSSRQLLKEAKELIRNLLRVTYGEGWNYSLDWKVKAEDFLKENK